MKVIDIKMTEGEKLSYFAGIIDGEGTITIYRQIYKSGYEPTYGMRLLVSSTDMILLEWCKENFEGTIQTIRCGEANHRDTYQWVLGMKKTRRVLLKVMPYLLIKQKQAELVLEFYEKCKRGQSRVGSYVPLWLRHKQEDYHRQIKAMHQGFR